MKDSQHGNNNVYCEDNETSWFDWAMVKKRAQLHRFVKLLIARRLLQDVEHERKRVSLNQLIREASRAWHGVKLGQPDWSDHSHSLALTAEIRRQRLIFHLIVNAYWEPLDFELPILSGGAGNPWRRWIDTSLDTPHDIVEWQAAPSTSSNEPIFEADLQNEQYAYRAKRDVHDAVREVHRWLNRGFPLRRSS